MSKVSYASGAVGSLMYAMVCTHPETFHMWLALLVNIFEIRVSKTGMLSSRSLHGSMFIYNKNEDKWVRRFHAGLGVYIRA